MWIERSPEMPALLLMCMMLGLSRGAPVHQQQRKPAIASQSGGGDSCVAALAKACGTKRSDVFACAECAGAHQQTLKAKGCGSDAIAAWCAGVPLRTDDDAAGALSCSLYIAQRADPDRASRRGRNGDCL